MLNTINDKHSVLVVAHPDDEAIFSSSLLDSVRLVIICFSEVLGDTKLSQGRITAACSPYLTKLVYLGIPQSATNDFFLHPKVNGLCDDLTRFSISNDYENNNKLLYSKIIKYLCKGDVVFTHNPWGEYGHLEHIQVFNVISDIICNSNFSLRGFVNGYVGYKAFYDMRSKSQLISNKALKLPSNRKIYALAEAHYRLHNCWTWSHNYSLPDYEYFYEIKSQSSLMQNGTSLDKTNLPLLLKHFIEFNIYKRSFLTPAFILVDRHWPKLSPLILFCFMKLFLALSRMGRISIKKK